MRVLEMIEAFDHIYIDQEEGGGGSPDRPRFHYVIIDYLCERVAGEARAGSDVTDLVYAGEDELPLYQLTETATRILRKAFAMRRERY